MTSIIHIIYSVLAGIVQGITEWLPISSTGHLIILDSLFGIDSFSQEFTDMFNIVIQFGSILAIIVLYFRRLNPFAPSKSKDEKKSTWALWMKIIVAAVPAGIVGLLVNEKFEESVFAKPQVYNIITATLFIYGVIFIIIEKVNKNKNKVYRIDSPEDLDYKTALGIGAFQILALVPGTSRSGSTIIGSTVLGVSRKAAAEFSFFLAIPIMVGASGLKIVEFIVKSGAGIASAFTPTEFTVLAIGTVVSFLVSLVAVKFLVEFVRTHSFEVFGWYRIALAVVVGIYFTLAR